MPAHRKPTAWKLLHGNRKSTINQHEPRFDGMPLPDCPQWLSPVAQQEWARVMSEFEHTGLITPVDMAALACYCQAFARWVQAEQQIEHEGSLVREPVITRSGHHNGKYKIKRHPAVMNSKDAQALMLHSAALFGLNPVSRTRVPHPEAADTVPVPDDDDSDLFVQ